MSNVERLAEEIKQDLLRKNKRPTNHEAATRRNEVLRLLDTPLECWRVIAGPPDVAIGSYPWRPVVHASKCGRNGAMRMGPAGFMIECAGCGKTFDSKGLRCCSTECERRYRNREANAALLAEVGSERPTKRLCQAGCGRAIPLWRNGRRVSKATRFCSPKCKVKAHRDAKTALPHWETLRADS